jgi:uncharacterized protein (UPF0128 family)
MDKDSAAAENKKIYDLTEVYEEKNGRNNSEVIVVDGRGYERIAKKNNDVHDLIEIVEDRKAVDINEEIVKKTTEIAERIARELIPSIAERVIREEIEKLKKMNGSGSATIN